MIQQNLLNLPNVDWMSIYQLVDCYLQLYSTGVNKQIHQVMKQKIIKSLKKRCTHNCQFQDWMLNLVAHQLSVQFRLQIPLLVPEIANKIMSYNVENIIFIYQQKTADGSDYYVKGVRGL
jgi:hypothetical protein